MVAPELRRAQALAGGRAHAYARRLGADQNEAGRGHEEIVPSCR